MKIIVDSLREAAQMIDSCGSAKQAGGCATCPLRCECQNEIWELMYSIKYGNAEKIFKDEEE